MDAPPRTTALLHRMPSTREDVTAVVAGAIGGVLDAGKVTASTVADGAESAARALAHRVVGDAVAKPRPIGDQRLLADALAAKPEHNLAGIAVGSALALRTLKRLGPLAKLTKRSPAWLAISALPAFAASVTRGADELAL